MCRCWPLNSWCSPLWPSRSMTCPFWWGRMRAKTTTLRMTVSTTDRSACCSMCSKAGPVTQHCTPPCRAMCHKPVSYSGKVHQVATSHHHLPTLRLYGSAHDRIVMHDRSGCCSMCPNAGHTHVSGTGLFTARGRGMGGGQDTSRTCSTTLGPGHGPPLTGPIAAGCAQKLV